MEPLGTVSSLRNRGEKIAAAAVVVLLSLFLLLPIMRSIGQLLLEADLSALSWIFWKIIGRSLGVTVVHAALAAVIAASLGTLMGSVLAFVPGRSGRQVSDVVQALGSLIFAFPGVLSALLVLGWARSLAWVPGTGLPAIILAHVLINVAFLTSNVNERLRAAFAAGGLDRWEAAATLGARRLDLIRVALGPLLRAELSVWLPLVFLWSFSAFATVVILGGSPATANLEVILFFSLQNADDSARVLVLMLLQFCIACLTARWAERVSRGSQVSSGNDVSSQAMEGSRFAWPAWSAVAIAALLALPYLPTLAAPLRLVLSGGDAPDGFGIAVGVTLGLSLMAAITSLAFFELVVRAGSLQRRRLTYGLGLSTTFLAAAWISSGIDRALDSTVSQVLAAGFAVSIVQWPLIAFWVERQAAALPEELWESAITLGAPLSEVHKRVLRPQLGSVRRRLAWVAFLGAAGELSFSSLFLRDVETVALLSRRLASRYDFSGSLWVLSFLVLVSVGGFLLQQRPRIR